MAVLPPQEVQYLYDLQDDANEGIEVEGDGPECLQPIDLQVDDVDVGTVADCGLGGGFEVAHEVDLVELAELHCMVLHPR